jgi:2-methylcitrate dehydratase PrpD
VAEDLNRMRVMPSLSRLMVRRVLGMRDTAPDVQRKVALCLLDHFACCLAVRDLPWTASVLRYAERLPNAPEAHHWWLGRRVAAPDAAFGNALLGHWLIRDDMHVPSASHIGVVVLPAMLALAQRENLSGRDLLTGIVAGYEAMAGAGMAIRSGAFIPHFRSTGIAGAFGAASGIVAALRLDETTGVNALGFAANFACGINEWSRSGGQEAYVHAGSAARHALVAVDLARAGLIASETVMEGQDGMFAAYHSSPDAARLFAEGIDTGQAAILQVEHKPFAGCNYILTPVAATLTLGDQQPMSAAEIDMITIRTFTAARAYPGCDCTGPFTSGIQAKMSLQYGVAATLLYGGVDEAVFERFHDPVLLDLISRCRLEIVARFDAAYPGRQPAEIEIRLRDGRLVKAALPDVPWLSADAVVQRFEAEAARHFTAATVQQIKDMVFSLARISDCRPLFDLISDLPGDPHE